MFRYIRLSAVFILLTSLIFLTTHLGYPQEQEQEIEQDEEYEEEVIEEKLTVDQKKIDEAVNKGVEFLLKKDIKGREMELMILTLLHAGVDQKKDRKLRAAIRQLSTGSLNDKFKRIQHKTYRIALMAMALAKADPYKYQPLIAKCAQALVNYQCQNGQWHYDCRYNIKHGKPRKTGEVAVGREAIVSGKKHKYTRPLKKILIKRRNKDREASGDNSNAQFALLGLHAAARCGIQIPKETWQEAADYLTKTQLSDGGWCYVETGRKVPYGIYSYGSMTCASLCGLAIAKFYLNPNQNLLADESIKKGLNWLARRFTFERNPGGVPFAQLNWVDVNSYLYYYIYGIERVGVVLKTGEIGGHNWYQEGAKYLLAAQAEDGSWHNPKDNLNRMVNTCFAILFLKKATAPLRKAIISGQSDKPSPPDDAKQPDDE